MSLESGETFRAKDGQRLRRDFLLIADSIKSPQQPAQGIARRFPTSDGVLIDRPIGIRRIGLPRSEPLTRDHGGSFADHPNNRHAHLRTNVLYEPGS